MSRWRTTTTLAAATVLLAAAGFEALEAQMTPEMQGLAGALLRLEYALKGRPPAPDALARVSRAFDQATLAFFAGRTEVVLQALDSLVGEVEPDAAVRARQREAAERAMAGLGEKGRVLEGAQPVPYRLHGPPGDTPGPLPVIVALHGAGGNEHMFLEAYGAGRLRELAEARGFVLISPATAALARAPDALSRLLDAAAAEYPIDRERVGVIGHSMGAGVAWQLAERQVEPLVGVACIAGSCGGGEGEGSSLPPLLLIAGEADPLVPPSRLEPTAAQGRARGVAVDYRVIPGLGHTLVVGAVLDDVVDWLLSRPPG